MFMEDIPPNLVTLLNQRFAEIEAGEMVLVK